MPTRDFWYCRKEEGGHIVGEVRSVALVDGSGRIPVLALYERALYAPPAGEVELRCGKVFHADGLRCSICGREFNWHPKPLTDNEVSDG